MRKAATGPSSTPRVAVSRAGLGRRGGEVRSATQWREQHGGGRICCWLLAFDVWRPVLVLVGLFPLDVSAVSAAWRRPDMGPTAGSQRVATRSSVGMLVPPPPYSFPCRICAMAVG
jgi:hypothetical protein